MKKNAIRAVESVRGKIDTTLYDLIEAVMEEVGTKESKLVTFVVLHLLGKTRQSETGIAFH